jgi:RNA polymerase sigma-70 factor (ECF subfamily)
VANTSITEFIRCERARRLTASREAYYGRIVAYARAIASQRLRPKLRRRLDSVDVAQDVGSQVLKDFPKFRGKGEKTLLAWVGRITRNKLALLGRRVKPMDAAVMDGLSGVGDEAPTPSSSAEARDQSVRVARLVDGLSREEREALTLRHCEGLTFEQIGEKLGKSRETARTTFARAEERFRERGKDLL